MSTQPTLLLSTPSIAKATNFGTPQPCNPPPASPYPACYLKRWSVTGGHYRVFPFPVSFGRRGHSGLPHAKERIIADLNHLFAGHQTALFNAAKAGSAQDQQTWNGLAEFYAERIRRMRAAAELPIYQWA